MVFAVIAILSHNNIPPPLVFLFQGVLNEFTYKLFDALEWNSEVNYFVQSTPESVRTTRPLDGKRIRPGSWEASDDNFERYIMVLMFSQRLLGSLDFDNGSNQQAARAAACYEFFFTQGLNPARVVFFTPGQKEPLQEAHPS
jgi:hypothetical protein